MKITLKTVEDLRFFPQWRAAYFEAEDEYAEIFELFSPLKNSDESILKELGTSYASRMKSWNTSLSSSGSDPKPPRISRAPRIL